MLSDFIFPSYLCGSSLIRYVKGNKNQGAIHIQKHLGDGSIDEVSKEELLNIGDIIRNGSLSKNYGKNVYYLKKNGIKYRVVTGRGKNDNEKVITFYSNRNSKEKKGYEISLITDNSSSGKTIIPQESEKIKKEILDKNGRVIWTNASMFRRGKEGRLESLHNQFSKETGSQSGDFSALQSSSDKAIIPQKNSKLEAGFDNGSQNHIYNQPVEEKFQPHEIHGEDL